jgi:CheY-like chemotaxis protein
MAPVGPPQAGTILIVEDDLSIRETLGEILRDEGYGVSFAEHGAAALSRLQNAPLPALILLDLMMPVMSGWEFRTQQLLSPELSQIPVVIVSGVSNNDAGMAVLAPAAVLPKPIQIPQLLELVSAYCRPGPARPTSGAASLPS